VQHWGFEAEDNKTAPIACVARELAACKVRVVHKTRAVHVIAVVRVKLVDFGWAVFDSFVAEVEM
jgi:hypothetical protein